MPPSVLQINTSAGGLPKTPVRTAELTEQGLVGDDHRNKKYHGGPARAVLFIASEFIQQLQDEGWPVFYGALGENITTVGFDHRLWRPGQRLHIGSTILQLTIPRTPCATLYAYGPTIGSRIFDKQVKALNFDSAHWGESGYFASVVKTGTIAVNDIITVVDHAV